jgi:two-component system, OmpR family, sensor histidine kinase KdpD
MNNNMMNGRRISERAALPGDAGDQGRPAPRAGVAAVYRLPLGCAALLVIGAIAAGTHGAVSAGWVLALSAGVVTAVGGTGEPGATLFVTGAAWLAVAGFSGPPYAQLRLTFDLGVRAALVLGACALVSTGVGTLMRRIASSFRLWIVELPEDALAQGGDPFEPPAGLASPRVTGDEPPEKTKAGNSPDITRTAVPAGPRATQAATAQPTQSSQATRSAQPAQSAQSTQSAQPTRSARSARTAQGGNSRTGGLDRRRQITGVLLVAILPLLTAALLPAQHALSLPDDLMIFLAAVVGVAVVGGFWPAVLAAVTASLLLNWYFTPPVHTFTIADPQNMLDLLLFVTVAVTVSSVVHLAARRAVQAARSKQEAAALLALAQTVLGGEDTPGTILSHLTATRGGRAELAERIAGRWVNVAVAGSASPGAQRTRVLAGTDLALIVADQGEPLSPRLLDGFAAQVAAALERDRLRTQAAQAEALAAGNRMRTALLAAVSHDLRTPLASIKASVSTLRQTGVELTADDEAALLATVEGSADRLNDLIANLLDMSRLNAGSLEPLLRPASVDEVAPLATADSASPMRIMLVVPDDLPLVRTDPGLLERVLANLFANAVEHSPADRPPTMSARQSGDFVLLEVADHGCGVPADLKSAMFEPFERLGERAGERASGNGIGLGLTVAKGLAEAMGASITALDTPGGGLTMRVTLPMAARAAESAMATEP